MSMTNSSTSTGRRHDPRVGELLRCALTMEDWIRELDKFITFWRRGAPPKCVEEVTAALAKAHAETEFEKYRVIQDRLFVSDYDRYLLELEEQIKNEKEDKTDAGDSNE